MSSKSQQKPRTSHRARIPADAMTVLVVQTVVLAGVWACAITVSFTGLVAAAGWANIEGNQRYGVPLFVDGILVGASLAYLVARERRDRASVWIALLAMTAFCGLSILGNATHALAGAAVGAQRVTGVMLAVAAPIAILVTTELLARTVIANPDETVSRPSRASRRAARTVAVLPAVTPALGDVPASPAPAVLAVPVRPARTEPVRAPRVTGADREALREAVLTHARGGLSQRQIGEATGLSKSTVGRILASAEGALVTRRT